MVWKVEDKFKVISRGVALFILVLISVFLVSCLDDEDKQGEGRPPAVGTTATLSITRIITGYTLPLPQSTIMSETVVLTVRPPDKAGAVQLVVTGQDRVTLINVVRDSVAGTVKFNAKGKSQTPATERDGDTKVEARDGTTILAEARAIVVIPKAVGTPHEQPRGPVIPENTYGDRSTAPPWPTAPTNKVMLYTAFFHHLTIKVEDQFGSPLHKVYAGTAVTEHAQIPMNKVMSASGTYTDAVGSLNRPVNPRVDKMVSDPQNPGQQILNPMITAFQAGPPMPMLARDDTQNIPVQVGGHQLNPGIVNRRVKSTPPNSVRRGGQSLNSE
jgi:hypothetical protein